MPSGSPLRSVEGLWTVALRQGASPAALDQSPPRDAELSSPGRGNKKPLAPEEGTKGSLEQHSQCSPRRTTFGEG